MTDTPEPVRLRVVQSKSVPWLVSVRELESEANNWGARAPLTKAGYKPGDVVEVRLVERGE